MNEFLTQLQKSVREHPAFAALGALFSLVSFIFGVISAIRGNLELAIVTAIIAFYVVLAMCVAFVLFATKAVDAASTGLGVTAKRKVPRYSNRTKAVWTILFIIAVLVGVGLFLSNQILQDVVSVAFNGPFTPTPVVEARIGTGTTRLFVETQPSNQIHVVLNLYFFSFFITATPASQETAIFVTQPAPIPLVNATLANPSATPPVALQGSTEGSVNLYPKMIAVLECPADGSVVGCNEQVRDIQLGAQQVEPAWEWYLNVVSENAAGKSIIVRVYGASSSGERVSDTPLWQTFFPVTLLTPTPNLDMTLTQNAESTQQANLRLTETQLAVVTATDIEPSLTPTPAEPTLDETTAFSYILMTQAALDATQTVVAVLTEEPTKVALESVVLTATALAELFATGQAGGDATPTREGAIGGPPSPTPGSLPQTGLFDDSLPNSGTVLLMALSLIGVILIARYWRMANSRNR